MIKKKTLALEDIELDFDIDELLADIERYEQLKKVRKEPSYIADLIRLLLPRPNGLSRQMVLHDLERNRRKQGLPTPPKFEEAVQSSYNQHSIDSAVFRKRNLPDSEAIFLFARRERFRKVSRQSRQGVCLAEGADQGGFLTSSVVPVENVRTVRGQFRYGPQGALGRECPNPACDK